MPKTNPIVDAYRAERASALLYETLADIEKDTRIAKAPRGRPVRRSTRTRRSGSTS